MNAHHLQTLIQFLANHGAGLLAGITALLAAGGLGARLQRSPLHRQRIGELTIACLLVWLALVCTPLPRWSFETKHAQETKKLAAPAMVHADGEEPTTAEAIAALTAVTRESRVPSTPHETLSSLSEVDRHPLTEAAPPSINLAPSIEQSTAPGSAAQTSPAAAPAATRSSLIVRGVKRVVALPASTRIAFAYLAIALACSAWLLLGRILLLGILRSAAPPPSWLNALFESVCDKTGGHARLLISSRYPHPVSFGLLRPTIVIPRPFAIRANAAQIRQVLLHELGHVRQRDAAGNALLNLALPLLWFHPLYWWVRSQVSLAREMVADDFAARHTTRESYVSELVAFAKTRGRLPAGSLAGIGIFGIFQSPTHFYRRMHMLLQRHEPLPTQCSTAWRLTTLAACGLALSLSAGVWGVRPASAQEDPRAAEQKEVAEHDRERAEVEAQRAKADAQRAQADEQRAQAEVQRAQARAQRDAARAEDEGRKQEADALNAAAREMDQRMKQIQQQLVQVQREADKLRQERDRLAQTRDRHRDRAQQNGVAEEAQARVDGNDPRVRNNASLQEQIDLFTRLGKMDSAQNQRRAGEERLSLSQLDLVSLANSYLDALGNLDLAKVKFARIAQLKEQQAVSDAEVAEADTALRTAERKAKLFRAIAEIAMDGAQRESKTAREREEKGIAPSGTAGEADAKAKILALILKSGESSGGSNGKTQRQ